MSQIIMLYMSKWFREMHTDAFIQRQHFCLPSLYRQCSGINLSLIYCEWPENMHLMLRLWRNSICSHASHEYILNNCRPAHLPLNIHEDITCDMRMPRNEWDRRSFLCSRQSWWWLPVGKGQRPGSSPPKKKNPTNKTGIRLSCSKCANLVSCFWGK